MNLNEVNMIKKTHKKIQTKLTYSCHLLQLGSYGLKLMENLCLTTLQINSLERALNQKLKELTGSSKKVKVWSKISTNKTLTKLSLESRMGKGKGPIYTEVLYLKQGSIIYEFKNIKFLQIKEIFKFLKTQISVNLLLISKK